MIAKEGRKPYDPEEPRVPLDQELRVAPPTYRSLQKSINSNSDGTANENKLNKYLEILDKKGFVEIDISDIYEVNLGSRVAYLTTDNKWRSGGFLVYVKDSNTNYDTEEENDEYRTYIGYKAFNNALYHVQEDDIQRLWVKYKKEKTTDGKVVIKKPQILSNYPIFVENEFGIETVIKYARDEFDRQRFITSKKYLRIIQNGWVFDDGTQELDLELFEDE